MVPKIEVEEYSLDGRSPFREWHDRLDAQAAAAVSIAIGRLADGNTSNVKSIGEGAAELKINRGPGYRVYFGWDGSVLLILLGGGTKHRQRNDISVALRRWRDYKARKRDEG
nr:type II toxin-antitoxin system RelE/ParE family toxin [Bradyrhizobium diazoefficiens]